MTSLHRIFEIELRLQAAQIGTSAVLGVLAVVLAATVTDGLLAVLPIWAALAWYRHGRADTVERRQLRATLGLSRADAVRGRVALIAAESAGLLLCLLLGTVLARLLAHRSSVLPGPTVSWSPPPGVPLGVELATAAAHVALILLLTAVAIGGEGVTRRPGRSMLLTGLVVYLGAGLLVAAPLGLVIAAVELDGGGAGPHLLVTAGIAACAVLLTLVLRRRVRVWIRQLDSAGAAAAPSGEGVPT